MDSTGKNVGARECGYVSLNLVSVDKERTIDEEMPTDRFLDNRRIGCR